jgi:hypothetical protein
LGIVGLVPFEAAEFDARDLLAIDPHRPRAKLAFLEFDDPILNRDQLTLHPASISQHKRIRVECYDEKEQRDD